jgi:hypothetical protein
MGNASGAVGVCVIVVVAVRVREVGLEVAESIVLGLPRRRYCQSAFALEQKKQRRGEAVKRLLEVAMTGDVVEPEGQTAEVCFGEGCTGRQPVAISFHCSGTIADGSRNCR